MFVAALCLAASQGSVLQLSDWPLLSFFEEREVKDEPNQKPPLTVLR